ncbi:unnamed protein product [Meloidogyne enterolobii]|uniref:Uncharacterized protein n=1 Tax=Meloidogyne enterolobii TaxID=390850 RepID=A0ACB1APQ8_MELEN
MSTLFNSCAFGLSSTKDDYFPFSAGFAIFCMTISTIWCFCCSKKKKGDDKEDNKRQSKVKSPPPIPAAKKTDSAAKKRRYSATPDKAKRQQAQARVRIPVVKPVVAGNPKAKGGDGGSKTKKPGDRAGRVDPTTSSPTTDSALLTVEPDESDFKMEDFKMENNTKMEDNKESGGVN